MRDRRQLECIAAIEGEGYNCYIEACVGFGKTIMALRLLWRMLEKGELNRGDRVLFQTSATTLLGSFIEEVKLCKELFGFDILESLEIDTYCYQSRQLTKRTDYQYLINDEADFPGEVLSNDFSLYKGRMLCMSGTFGINTLFEYKGTEISKRDWIDSILPCAFRYTINEGREDGIVTGFDTTIIYHKLTDLKYGKIWKNQSYDYSEQVYWKKVQEQVAKHRFYKPDDHIDRLRVEARNKNPNRQRDRNVRKYMASMDFQEAYVKGKLESEKKKYEDMVRFYGTKATSLINNAPSKIAPARRILDKLEGRTIVWARNLDFLDKLIGKERVIRDGEILKRFNNLELNIVGTSKKILREKPPTLVDNLFMCAPMESATELELLIGKVIRTDTRKDKFAHLYIIVTVDTYAEHWLRKSCKKGNSYIDLNIKNTVWL